MALAATTRHVVAGVALAALAYLVLHWSVLMTFRAALIALAFAEGLVFARRVVAQVDGAPERVRGRDVVEIVAKAIVLGGGVWLLGQA